MSDAGFVTDFSTEVGRSRETKAALAGGGPLPTGNWVHVFETFRDVVDVLQGLPNLQRPVEEAAFRRLLRSELAEMLRRTLHRSDGTGRAFSPRHAVDDFHAEHQFGTADVGRRVDVVTARFDALIQHSIHLLGVHLPPVLIARALESPAFLQFDHAASVFREEPALAGLHRLTDELWRFSTANTSETFQVVFANAPTVRPHRPARLDVDGFGLVSFLSLLDRWCNIIELCTALIRHLDGDVFVMPSLRPRSTIADDTTLESEEATAEQVEAYLRR